MAKYRVGEHSSELFWGNPKKPVGLTSGPTFVTLRRWKRALSTSDSWPTPRRAKSDFLSAGRVPTGKHARYVVEVIEKAYESAEMGQAQILKTTIDG